MSKVTIGDVVIESSHDASCASTECLEENGHGLRNRLTQVNTEARELRKLVRELEALIEKAIRKMECKAISDVSIDTKKCSKPKIEGYIFHTNVVKSSDSHTIVCAEFYTIIQEISKLMLKQSIDIYT